MKPMKRDYLYNILESFEILAASRHPEKGKINGIKDEILKNHDNLMAEIDFFTHITWHKGKIFSA